MASENVKRLYRAAERFPPRDKEYRSLAAKGIAAPEGATAEQLRSQTGLSSWDTVEAAMRVAERMRSAHWVVAYDIPGGRGVSYEQTNEPGHYDIHGDMEELKGYLVEDFKAEVQRVETREQRS